jgi:hypothetical protein
MSEKSGFEGVYRSGESPKRRAEVLERLRAGMTESKIAADLGIPPHAVSELVEQLRADGELPSETA